ncbi:MAG: hypothetical protein O6931_00885, partial [Gammaproteobacteria bacterium]|nr:hypothetical protein [Gammaproteobacteria bacterium]
MNKWMICLIGLLLSSVTLAGEEFDKTLPADADGDVLISNIAGLVDIHGWDKKEVRVVGELGRGVRELVFVRDGSHVEIRV